MLIDLRLDGKRVIVTAASSGIGAAARAFAAGARIALHRRTNTAAAAKVAAATGAVGSASDALLRRGRVHERPAVGGSRSAAASGICSARSLWAS